MVCFVKTVTHRGRRAGRLAARPAGPPEPRRTRM